MNKRVPAGTHTGLDTMIKGRKNMRPRTAPATVRPVRRRKTEAVTRRGKMPASWVELGARSWSFWRNAAEREGGGAVALWAWAGLGYWSAMVEGKVGAVV